LLFTNSTCTAVRTGLNLPKQMYVTLYERNCDERGMVDVEAFCKKVVNY
jgi:hypothetical protein